MLCVDFRWSASNRDFTVQKGCSIDFTEIASIGTVLATVAALVIGWLELRLKPINNRISRIEDDIKNLDETMSLIVDGLLNNNQIPKQK